MFKPLVFFNAQDRAWPVDSGSLDDILLLSEEDLVGGNPVLVPWFHFDDLILLVEPLNLAKANVFLRLLLFDSHNLHHLTDVIVVLVVGVLDEYILPDFIDLLKRDD
jgi:hypothetical protein